MYTLLLTGALAASRPMLPAGKGGLILIAGGVVMVTIALLWLTVTPRSALLVNHASVYHAGTTTRGGSGNSQQTRPKSRDGPAIVPAGEGPRPWAAFIRDAARGSGYGSAQVESVTAVRCLIRIEHKDARVMCRDEERCLRRAAHRIARGAKVTEVACGATCLFEVRLRRN